MQSRVTSLFKPFIRFNCPTNTIQDSIPQESNWPPDPDRYELGLPIIGVSDIMTDMKRVTLRSLLRDAAVLDKAAGGEEILVTRFGKPYVRIISAAQPRTFLGAGKHLRQKKAVSPEPILPSEWKGLD
jgi:antitoxin (DNA-binding transcriptional repressor) of toxin-antitoxin stability system